MPFRGGAGELDNARPGHGLAFAKDDSQPSEEAGLRVADLGEASKESVVGIRVIHLHVAGELLYSDASVDFGVVGTHGA